MKEDLVEFETAKLAKKKGFNIPVKKAYKVYNGYSDMKVNSFKIGKCDHNSLNGNCYNTSAPRQSLLQKWLRKKYGFNISLTEYNKDGSLIITITRNRVEIYSEMTNNDLNEFEQVLEKCLQIALNHIKI